MATHEFNYKLDVLEGALRPYALKLTRNLEDANDLLQETYLKAYSNKDKFSEGTNLKAWMYTIMKNTFFTNYQRMLRRNTFIDTTDNLHYINSVESISQNEAEDNFKMGDVEAAIDKLDDTYKVPFSMYFQGYKYHEIADQLQIPLGTVKNRIHIARKELKDVLSIYAFN